MQVIKTTIEKYCDDVWNTKYAKQTLEYWDGKGQERKCDQEKKVSALLNVFCSSGKTLLDAGCGSCRLYPLLSDMFEYTGLDGSEAMLAYAPEGAFTIHSDILKCDLPPASFDIVLCSHVIRHNLRGMQYKLINRLFKLSSKYVVILNTFVEHWYGSELMDGHVPENPLVMFEFEHFCWKNQFEPLVKARLENTRDNKLDYIYVLRRLNG